MNRPNLLVPNLIYCDKSRSNLNLILVRALVVAPENLSLGIGLEQIRFPNWFLWHLLSLLACSFSAKHIFTLTYLYYEKEEISFLIKTSKSYNIQTSRIKSIIILQIILLLGHSVLVPDTPKNWRPKTQ